MRDAAYRRPERFLLLRIWRGAVEDDAALAHDRNTTDVCLLRRVRGSLPASGKAGPRISLLRGSEQMVASYKNNSKPEISLYHTTEKGGVCHFLKKIFVSGGEKDCFLFVFSTTNSSNLKENGKLPNNCLSYKITETSFPERDFWSGG